MTLRTWLTGARSAYDMAALGDGVLAKARLFVVAFLGERKWPTGRSVLLRLRAYDRSFSCSIDDYTQLQVLREVFLDEDYRVDGGEPPATVVDLGSNIGASLIYFRLRYPDARLIGVEPDPLAFARLRQNIAPFEGVEAVNAAVAPESGHGTLFQYPGHSWANSLLPLWGPSDTRVTVTTRTLDDLLDDFGLDSVDLLKIDIEGGEWDVLPSFRLLDRVRTMIGEVHRIGAAPPAQLVECLGDFSVSIRAEGHHVLRFVATRDEVDAPPPL